MRAVEQDEKGSLWKRYYQRRTSNMVKGVVQQRPKISKQKLKQDKTKLQVVKVQKKKGTRLGNSQLLVSMISDIKTIYICTKCGHDVELKAYGAVKCDLCENHVVSKKKSIRSNVVRAI
jgi:DNA-directed RNA polymerase subunit RPC12/RpoP